MNSSAEKDKAVPNSVCKRDDTIGFEEEDAREEHQTTDGHLEQTLTLSLGEVNDSERRSLTCPAVKKVTYHIDDDNSR